MVVFDNFSWVRKSLCGGKVTFLGILAVSTTVQLQIGMRLT